MILVQIWLCFLCFLGFDWFRILEIFNYKNVCFKGLIMKHNIIQMTATAGLIVPHSISPISSFQMKPTSTSEAMLISKIVAFVAQKIQTSSLRSRCTHNKCCLVRILVQWHNWAIFFENEQGVAVTVNSERYRAMLNEFFRKSNNQPKF